MTKRELAVELGVAKQTVSNYIDRLALAPGHVTRRGRADYLDEFAASAIADAVGKALPAGSSETGEGSPSTPDPVVSALNERIADLVAERDRARAELGEERAERSRETGELRAQLADANARAADLADRLAGMAERQQAIAAAPWWMRARMAMRLLGRGDGE